MSHNHSKKSVYDLRTAKDFTNDPLLLLEIDNNFESVLQSDERIVIIGNSDDKAVLCTNNHSFFINKEDISNNRLLTTHIHWEQKEQCDNASTTKSKTIIVQKSTNCHFVLEPKPFDIALLKSLLMENPYFPESERKGNENRKSYTIIELAERLQVSTYQVELQLQKLHAFQINGHCRILDPRYQERVFETILHVVSENEWDVFSKEITIDQLQSSVNEPREAVKACLHIYGNPSRDRVEQYFVLDKEKVAVFFAKQLFQELRAQPMTSSREKSPFSLPSYSLQQFMEKWHYRVPEQVSVDLRFLQGHAVVSNDLMPRIVYFPDENLPLNAIDRFKALFDLQEIWTLAALDPYLKALVHSEGVTKEDLLLQYTRTISESSTEKLYARR